MPCYHADIGGLAPGFRQREETLIRVWKARSGTLSATSSGSHRSPATRGLGALRGGPSPRPRSSPTNVGPSVVCVPLGRELVDTGFSVGGLDAFRPGARLEQGVIVPCRRHWPRHWVRSPVGPGDRLRGAARHAPRPRAVRRMRLLRGLKCPRQFGVTSQNLSQRIALPVMHQVCRPTIFF